MTRDSAPRRASRAVRVAGVVEPRPLGHADTVHDERRVVHPASTECRTAGRLLWQLGHRSRSCATVPNIRAGAPSRRVNDLKGAARTEVEGKPARVARSRRVVDLRQRRCGAVARLEPAERLCPSGERHAMCPVRRCRRRRAQGMSGRGAAPAPRRPGGGGCPCARRGYPRLNLRASAVEESKRDRRSGQEARRVEST